MVNNIYKFIIHVVYNLFPLNEYSEGEMRNLMTKFKEEADDLNTQISDEQLKLYINRFDQLKNSPKITEKDLRKYSLAQLIKLVSKSAGADAPEEIDLTPDVVYNNDNNTIVVYNGSKEGNCINFGQGEKWCITRGSYGNYRYSKDRGYPTFYLAKNTNLPDSDKLSFVAIQVRDTPEENKRYVYTNRINSPYESNPMNFSSLLSEVPWLQEIPNIKNILKYIPLSTSEKTTQLYASNPISIREWSQLPFETKKQYLVVRKGKSLFSDINNGEFVSKYLPEYPQLATFISINSGIIDNEILLKYLGTFSNQDRKSIIANMRDLVDISTYLTRDTFSFDVKKLLAKLNKWDLKADQRIYVTKDDKAIVLLTDVNSDIKVGVYTEDADYPNIKLNKRTSRFLTDYPELDKIPFKTLAKLVSDEAVDKSLLDKVIEKSKEDPDSGFIVKDVEDGQILIDTNSFTSFKIKDNKVSSIPFTSEEVQNILNSDTGNTSLQNGALNLLKSNNIPELIDKETFQDLISSIPINQRKVNIDGEQKTAVVVPNEAVLLVDNTPITRGRAAGFNTKETNREWRTKESSYYFLDEENVLRAYFEFLRGENIGYNDRDLLALLNSTWRTDDRRNIIRSNPPMVDNSIYKPLVIGDNYLLLNKNDSRQSKIISPRSGKLINYNFPPRAAAQYLGTPVAAQQQPAGEAPRRRGRPARGAAQPAAAPAQGEVNQDIVTTLDANGLINGINSLPTNIKNRFLINGVVTSMRDDRGVTRRNNALRGRGRVMSVISAGQNRLYIIRLNSGTTIGSIATQPDGQHFIVTSNSAFRIPNAAAFIDQLQARNLSENAKAIISLHAEARPQDIEEIKYLLKNKKHETQRS